jgi:hypothetical protein
MKRVKNRNVPPYHPNAMPPVPPTDHYKFQINNVGGRFSTHVSSVLGIECRHNQQHIHTPVSRNMDGQATAFIFKMRDFAYP